MKFLTTTYIVVSCLFIGMVSLNAQSKKDIRENKIKSQTVLEIFIEEGYDQPVVEQKEIYNEDGDVIELIEYNKDSEVTRWEKYEYDEDGNVILQVFLDNKGKVEKKEKTIYKDGIRIERQFFDNKDRMYKKKIYEYEYRK